MQAKTMRWLDGGKAVLRVSLGVVLLTMGVRFVQNMSGLVEAVPGQQFPLGAFLLAHLIVFAHMGGGVMLGFGLRTRLAAALQLPILMGALGLVEFGHGFFANVGPAFTASVALMVGVVTLVGGGALSVDRWLGRLALTPAHEAA